MTVSEFLSIRPRMTADYLNRMFGDSYANIARDGRDVFPASGGGWYYIYYDKHNRVVRKEYIR